MVHSDPDRGDLWVGQDDDTDAAGAITVDDVSKGLFFPIILIISYYITVVRPNIGAFQGCPTWIEHVPIRLRLGFKPWLFIIRWP